MAFISPKHNAVGVPVQGGLVSIFPDAKRVVYRGTDYIILPHELDVVRLLRNMGEPVDAPILTQYNWCGGTPFEVQRKTCAMLTTNPRAFVLNGMGTGKTKAAIWAYDFLRAKGHVKKAIVVAPLSTLKFTWQRELFLTAPHLKTAVLHGSAKKRKELLAADYDVYIINPDGVEIIYDEIMTRTDIGLLVLDEVATFRNGGAKRSKVVRKIAQHIPWCWGMTGSPTPNSPTDAWGQCRIVNPSTVPEFFGRFRDMLQYKITQFKWGIKDGSADVVYKAMSPAVRYTLDDVVELPDVVERPIDVALSSRQKSIYDALRTKAVALIGTQEINAANAAAVLNKLLQVSIGYVYDSDHNVIDLGATARLDALIDIINSTDRKVIVFSPFTSALAGVNERLTREGIESRVVDGSTSSRERDLIFPMFQQTDRLKVLNAHPNTMSHGLTLTAADTIVWFGPTTSLEVFEQANARIRRIGQKHRQQIIMLQSTAAERKIYVNLRAKQKVQDNILDLFAANT